MDGADVGIGPLDVVDTVENWTTTLLPVLVGPAILVGLYATVAHVGQKRIERQISSLDATEGE